MMTNAPITGAKDAADYYARDNYYTKDNGVEHSWWQGKAAMRLGLEGRVDADIFQRLLEGNITDGVQLGRKTKEGVSHRGGWDFTFSAPKSISILSEIYGVSALRTAHETAVKTALTYAETNLARARIMVDGKVKPVQTGNTLVAAFTHDVSREQDPQIHTHTILMNATETVNGWRSLSPELFFKRQKQFSQVYKTVLKNEVTRLGFSVRPSRFDRSLFEIDGVSDSFIEFYSQRSREIRESLKNKGIDYNSADARIAALKTRKRKKTVARKDLRDAWYLNASEFLKNHSGLSVDVAKKVNALQNVDDQYVEVSADVFSTQVGSETDHYDDSGTKTTNEFVVSNNQENALLNLADYHLSNKSTVVLARDELERSSIDNAIRKRLKDMGKLVGEEVMLNTLSPVYGDKSKKQSGEFYKINDRIINGDSTFIVDGINAREGFLVLRDEAGNRVKMDIKKITTSYQVARFSSIKIQAGEKVRLPLGLGSLPKNSVARVNKIEHGSMVLWSRGKEYSFHQNEIRSIGYDYSRISVSKNIKNKTIVQSFSASDDLGDRISELRQRQSNHKVFNSSEVQERVNYLRTQTSKVEAVRPVRHGIRHLQERDMAVSDESLIKSARKFNRRSVDDLDLLNEISRLKEKGYLIPAPRHSDKPDVALWTTQKAIKKELKLISTLEDSRAFSQSISTVRDADYMLRNTKLNTVQKTAVLNTLTSESQFYAIQGDPGVGKTTALNELRTLASRKNFDVYGFAPSHQAVSELSKSLKIKGFTVDRFLVDKSIQRKNKSRRALWIVDESSMLSTDKINDMMQLATEQGAKVLFVGDHQQLESIGAGRGFKQLLDSGIEHSVIDKRMRQKTDGTRLVVDKIMGKDYDGALTALRESRNLQMGEDEDEAIKALVTDWKSLSIDERAETLVIAPANEQRLKIDNEMRSILKDEGKIERVGVVLPMLQDKHLTEQEKRRVTHFDVGDVIRFNSAHKDVLGLRKDSIKRDDYFKVLGVKSASNELIIEDLKFKKRAKIDTRLIGGNLAGGISVYTKPDIELSVGDKVRWMDSRGHLGIGRNTEGVVKSVTKEYVRFEAEGKSVKISNDNLKDIHLSHSYSKTAYNVQGATAKRAFALMEGWRKNTTNQRSFMVALTRATHAIKVFTSSHSLGKDIKSRSADNTRAVVHSNRNLTL